MSDEEGREQRRFRLRPRMASMGLTKPLGSPNGLMFATQSPLWDGPICHTYALFSPVMPSAPEKCFER